MSGSSVRVQWLLLASVIACLLLVPSAASAYTFGSEVSSVGSFETVFDYSQPPPDAQGDPQANWCGDRHFFQDAGTRAVRDHLGGAALIMSHAGTREPPTPSGTDTSGAHTRRIWGAGGTLENVGAVGVDCSVVHNSHKNTNPSLFDRWEWLLSPFTEDGQTFHALVHNEYHGWEHQGQCPVQTGFYPRCWYNAITLAKSTNRGNLYTHAPAPNHLVATHPYTYSTADPSSKGYFQPTNIVKKDGSYYALFRAEAHEDQERGTCAMRTDNLDDPSSWRLYRNGSFSVDPINPYTETFDPAQPPVCDPLDDARALANNLVWSRYFKRWMLIDQSHIGVNGTPTDGVFYSLSDDLIHWDSPKLLMEAAPAWNCAGSQDPGIRVPTLIDPNSSDRNFNTIGQTAHLYFTQSQTCPETLNRDLVRVRVRFDAKPAGDRAATFESGQCCDPADGFDSAWSGSPGRIDTDTWVPYEGTKSAKLTYLGGSTGPSGSFHVSWPNGKDVWYGSAFWLYTGFAQTNNRIMIMRWHDSSAQPPSPSRYGGIVLGTDDRYRLVRGVAGGAEEQIGPSFTLSEGVWTWVEVHQELESDPANAPFSEVYVDGRPVMDANLVIGSTAVNAYPDSAVPIRIQYGFAERTPGDAIPMWIDRSSVSINQRGRIDAPPTPGPLSGSEQNELITLSWAGTPPIGGGFRVYKRDPDTKRWSQKFQMSGNSTLEHLTGQNCKRFQYRVSAYDAQGRESVPTEPIELMPRPSGGCPGA